jgi:hypothetical protein
MRTALPNVRLGSLADIGGQISDVRFTPKSGHAHDQNPCPLSATRGRRLRTKRRHLAGVRGDESENSFSELAGLV